MINYKFFEKIYHYLLIQIFFITIELINKLPIKLYTLKSNLVIKVSNKKENKICKYDNEIVLPAFSNKNPFDNNIYPIHPKKPIRIIKK
jgi:hypothetical protein